MLSVSGHEPEKAYLPVIVCVRACACAAVFEKFLSESAGECQLQTHTLLLLPFSPES